MKTCVAITAFKKESCETERIRRLAIMAKFRGANSTPPASCSRLSVSLCLVVCRDILELTRNRATSRRRGRRATGRPAMRYLPPGSSWPVVAKSGQARRRRAVAGRMRVLAGSRRARIAPPGQARLPQAAAGRIRGLAGSRRARIAPFPVSPLLPRKPNKTAPPYSSSED
jgi:hypothetical protein